MKSFLFTCLNVAFFTFSANLAHAEVRIGGSVSIGGNKIKPQLFDNKNRGRFIIYENEPKKEGCRIRKKLDGSKTKTCHLKRKK